MPWARFRFRPPANLPRCLAPIRFSVPGSACCSGGASLAVGTGQQFNNSGNDAIKMFRDLCRMRTLFWRVASFLRFH